MISPKNLKVVIKELQQNVDVLVNSICQLLIKPIRDPITLDSDINHDDSIIEKILSEIKMNDILFISTDGSSINTQEYTRTVGLNATVNLLWGPEFDVPIIIKKYRESEFQIPSLISTERIQQELITPICILTTIKTGELPCKDCPILKNNCILKSKKNILRDLTNFRAIGILDLTIDFSFIKKQAHVSPQAKNLILNTVKWVYRQIRDNNLEIIFITHGSRDKRFMYEIKNDIDYMFKRSGEFDTKLIEEIKKYCENNRNDDKFSSIRNTLRDFVRDFKVISHNYTDFDLFRSYFNKKGNSTPLFQIKDPNSLEYYEGVETGYMLTTWGYFELIDNKFLYVPLDDIKVGFPLNSDPEFLYKLFLFDTALGKGHSLSLTLAHTLISPGRKTRELLSQILADLHQIPKSLKNIQKWRFMK
ncbi:MAG: hypothetical protein EAX96_06040 [Candidatus Lokiarchaeota archaeon]|nr:hypothetical protein [Candidatus Lokiarchaeota archaeon]